MRGSRLVILLGTLAIAIPPLAAAVVKAQRPSRGDATSDELDLVTIFDSLELHSAARSFRGGAVLCWYGGGTLDLTGATLDPGGAHLAATCLFGGMELRVPNEWTVEVRSKAFLGGVGDARPAAGSNVQGAPTLVLDVVSAFGGIGITGPRSERSDPAAWADAEPGAAAG